VNPEPVTVMTVPGAPLAGVKFDMYGCSVLAAYAVETAKVRPIAALK
jgi:hypothetical protein